MVLADLGRKITSALRSLGNATIINEEVGLINIIFTICHLLLHTAIQTRLRLSLSKHSCALYLYYVPFRISTRYTVFMNNLKFYSYQQRHNSVASYKDQKNNQFTGLHYGYLYLHSFFYSFIFFFNSLQSHYFHMLQM